MTFHIKAGFKPVLEMSPQTECEFGVCPTVGLRQINFLPRHKVIISEKKKEKQPDRVDHNAIGQDIFPIYYLTSLFPLLQLLLLLLDGSQLCLNANPRGKKKKKVKKNTVQRG